MNAKEYLNQARVLDRRINITLERVSQLRSLTQCITPAYDGEVVSHTRNVTSLQDTIVRLLEAEDLLNSTIDTLVDLKTEISGVLKQIHDPDCRLLLEMRYLAFKSWEEISEIMHLHIRSTYKMHGRALKAVEEIINAPGFESVIKLGS